MSDFVHLHCHTEYSLLDGAIRIGDLCAKAKKFGMPAAAITDHGNMFGAAHFYSYCKDYGIKPLVGSEVYVCADHTDRDSALAKVRHHLVLLAKNEIGYRNLLKLVSKGFLHGFHYKPRLDKAMLRDHAEGLIALSACIAGEIPRAIRHQGMDRALELAKEYESIYPGNFYLEIQSNGLKEQEEANAGLLELAHTTGLPLVATNDCHYLEASDVDAHDVLLCIQTQATVDDPKRMRFETRELYYKTAEEMQASFSHVPESISNTVRIAEACNLELRFDKNYFPVYDLPPEMTLAAEFRRLAEEGLQKRLDAHPEQETLDREVYKKRLENEITMINDMGFAGYFLIVQDFINWAKNNGIPVGPGRGSAAGSLVAYALRITNLDPLPYNLLFERFLNSERVSMPDIDVDFCERRRTEVIRYVTEKYGEDSVAQITTFGKMKARAVVRDVGRALGFSVSEVDRIAKLVPVDLKITVQKALAEEPALAEMYQRDLRVKTLLDTSMRLEGLSRHASTHAAGVVISDKAMDEYLPLYRGKKGEIVTQFDMKMVEKVGLVKFDFLGLRTMTLIQDTLDTIRRQGIAPPDLDTLPLTDAATYELYTKGDTDGIFQVESQGMRQYLRRLKPNCFEDIIAMLALYRPGPLGSGMVDEFIKRKNGETDIKYPLPSLEGCLKDTYGVIVYQEQVMQIAQIAAGYTLGGADLLRRAMGKKSPEAMAKERSKFVSGATARGTSEKKANEVFDLMEKFAEYGFNKSHSAAYALISYHTAYLKRHHKVEFMAALLTSEMGNQDKLLKYVASCKDMEIEVLPPTVNASLREFAAFGGKVIFGLGGIKNVGDEAIREIVSSREAEGEFANFLDLACRVNLRKVTKRVFESLIKGGALDCMGITRAALLAAVDIVVARAQKKAKDKGSGQISLLAMAPAAVQAVSSGIGFDCPEQKIAEMEAEEKMRMEKEALGFYLTSHPLQPYRRHMERMGIMPFEELDVAPNTQFKAAVLVTACKEWTNKKGDRMAFLTVEDLTGQAEATVFADLYAKTRDLLKSGQPLLLEARLDSRDVGSYDDEEEEDAPRSLKFLVTGIQNLAAACASSHAPVDLPIPANRLDEASVLALRAVLEKHRGAVEARAIVSIDGCRCYLSLGDFMVSPGPALEKDFESWIN